MTNLVSTGVAGLDAVLDGGLDPSRLYLIDGVPGAGKTTLAMQFLLEGVRHGQPGLYITLTETANELVKVATSHGWVLDGITLFELEAAERSLSPARDDGMFHPWEIELGATVELIVAEAERTGATRVVFDSLSEMRLLAQDGLRFRRQILAFKQFFSARGATVLLVDDRSATAGRADLQLHTLCHGVITLDRLIINFGAARRRLEVTKMRGASCREGWHDYVIRKGGLDVIPRLVETMSSEPFVGGPVPSGVDELDLMLDGGPLRGTCTLLSGPAGSGKSTLALQYVHAAAARGEHCVVYQFDERTGTLMTRSAKIGLNLEPQVAAGRIVFRQINPSETSPGEFVQMLRADAQDHDAQVVVIDSLNGYLTSMPQEHELVLRLHELLTYLNQRGVLSLLISPQSGLMGNQQSTINVSYIADAIIVLRFFEAAGKIRKALSIMKNRGGGHEDTIRELRIDAAGLRLGPELDGFRDLLSGAPIYEGDEHVLLDIQTTRDG